MKQKPVSHLEQHEAGRARRAGQNFVTCTCGHPRCGWRAYGEGSDIPLVLAGARMHACDRGHPVKVEHGEPVRIARPAPK